ncbi:unnamed protein product [Rotaria sordida]|uniref:Helix-turn-helix domain-containing protein n=1 Tax=Rotaria sordida TaxID=392033 RepID=A0A815INX5_9BILA|nr:unnamed protein product [Rotaria sordida]
MENRDSILFTTVYQKPSYEPYYLPFNSIHPLHMKKNIPFTMLLRVIRYCSTFQTYLDEREKLRMALLLNKYPNKLIEEQFNNVLLKCNIDQPLTNFNYDKYRQKSGRLTATAGHCTTQRTTHYEIFDVGIYPLIKRRVIHANIQFVKLNTTSSVAEKQELSRFVMQNNYFAYDGEFYHQIRGGAMGSQLTLTMANCYMFFFERRIAKQIKNSGGLYFRYIDDLFIVINWSVRHLMKQIELWNQFDENIKLNANFGSFTTFLDLYMENRDGILFTTVYQKPSYEPYYLPFNNALPQREIFARKNTTQPFTVNENNQNQQVQQQQQQQNHRQRKTTSSFRRRQRRNNRFLVLADENDNISDVEVEVNDESILLNINKKTRKDKDKKKIRRYLEPNSILKWLEEHSRSSKNAISRRGNQAYVLASTSIYDECVRNNYELQVWQAYLKMGTEQKHWAKEVVRRTKRRDDVINTRFVQKKINRLTTAISEACATISDLQIQLSTLAQTTANLVAKQLSVERGRQTITAGTVGIDTDDELDTETAGAAPTTTTTTVKNYVREPVECIEIYILEYIHFCTQHVKKMAQSRIQIAKAQMEEFKALEDFEQIATPAQ